MRSEAIIQGQETPYLYSQYDVSPWFVNPLSSVGPVITCIFNALVEALNENKKQPLPKYIIVMPNKDILASLNVWNYGVKAAIQCNMFWLLKEITKALLHRRDTQKSRRPGAVSKDPTRIIWVKMLTRLIIDDDQLKKSFFLKEKIQ